MPGHKAADAGSTTGRITYRSVWVSLIGVVAFGPLTGSMLPFLLRRVGFDPATCSAPFVATPARVGQIGVLKCLVVCAYGSSGW